MWLHIIRWIVLCESCQNVVFTDQLHFPIFFPFVAALNKSTYSFHYDVLLMWKSITCCVDVLDKSSSFSPVSLSFTIFSVPRMSVLFSSRYLTHRSMCTTFCWAFRYITATAYTWPYIKPLIWRFRWLRIMFVCLWGERERERERVRFNEDFEKETITDINWLSYRRLASQLLDSRCKSIR